MRKDPIHTPHIVAFGAVGAKLRLLIAALATALVLAAGLASGVFAGDLGPDSEASVLNVDADSDVDESRDGTDIAFGATWS